jgi:predicted 3-demethylubiquinone-9 3-methyltransferase (glyoxalase superfamily)
MLAATVAGETVQCGWVTVRFGFSWLVVSGQLVVFMNGSGVQATNRVVQVIFAMTKHVIA